MAGGRWNGISATPPPAPCLPHVPAANKALPGRYRGARGHRQPPPLSHGQSARRAPPAAPRADTKARRLQKPAAPPGRRPAPLSEARWAHSREQHLPDAKRHHAEI